jgi:DHA2 family multidrug resistance protein
VLSVIMLVYYGSMALTPQMLQGELNYPVQTAGIIMAPRGLGTIGAILLVGRISKLTGPRLLIGFGLLVSAVSLYLMSRWSLDVSARDIVLVGLIQGSSIGFINVPLTTTAFSTLDSDLRTEASGFYNLIRNIGSAAGISITSAILVSSIQVNHGYLTEHMTPFGGMGAQANSAKALTMLNANITQQAAMVGYINVFAMLSLLCLLIIPVAGLLRVSKTAPSGPAVIGE